MPTISREEAWEVFLKEGKSSSHFVCFLAGLEFFKATDGTVFAYREKKKMCLLALDPMGWQSSTLSDSLSELQTEMGNKALGFVGIEEEFSTALTQRDYSILKVAEEPWIDLKKGLARGNSGKSVRAAINRARKNNVQVELKSNHEILTHPELREEIHGIFEQWKKMHGIYMGGFLNTTEPFYASKERYYFVARWEGKIVGFLVASPIPKIQSIYLEDLFRIPNAPRGVAELLISHAILYLKDKGYAKVSLGAVTLREIKAISKIPALFKALTKVLEFIVRSLANYSGLDVFRSRFSPHEWRPIFLALHKPHGNVGTTAWLSLLLNLFTAFHAQTEWMGPEILEQIQNL